MLYFLHVYSPSLGCTNSKMCIFLKASQTNASADRMQCWSPVNRSNCRDLEHGAALRLRLERALFVMVPMSRRSQMQETRGEKHGLHQLMI